MITFTSSATPSMTAYSTTATTGPYMLTVTGKITGHLTIFTSASFHFIVSSYDVCSISVITPTTIADIT
jgi:hypothetical protein